jgi:hypothetical protein
MRVATRPRCLLLLLAVCASGCIDRSRLNATCEWTRDSAFPLDLNRPADRRHLVADAQLAEGLAVRYADTEHLRRYGYAGHGGLIQHGQVVRECMARMVAVIERSHGVTPEQINAARGQRDERFDATVMLSFAAAYVVAAIAAARWIRRRFVDAPAAIAVAITTAASIALSALGMQLGAIWTAIWEAARIGDDHLGTFRAARVPWGQHAGEIFAAGVVIFWVTSLVVALRAPEVPQAETN